MVPELREALRIRAASAPDAEAIARVRVAAWRAAYRGLMPEAYLDRPDLERVEAEQLRARLHNIDAAARVAAATFGGQIVGYCAYGAGGNDTSAASGGIYDLYVHPDAWRHGVGGRLLLYALEHIKAQGFGEATLFVIEGNARARQFYEKMGWKADGYRGMYAHSGFALPILRYRITCA